MSDQKRHGPENDPRSAVIANEVEARPVNWAVPVSLVLLRECSSYGYELMERMAEFGLQAMNPGTLYRALRKMEKVGHCESEWETASGGPARRMYSVTDAGQAYLDLWVESLELYQQSMDAFFQAYRSTRPRSSLSSGTSCRASFSSESLKL